MDRFLTRKALTRRGWELPVLGLLGIVFAIAFKTCLDTVHPEDLFIDLIADVVVMAIFAWPFYPILSRIVRRRLAKRMAEGLERSGADRVPLERLDAVTGVKNARKKLKMLIDKGYIEDVRIDMARGVVELEGMPEPVEELPEPDGFEETLRRIRALNDAIDDEPVSRRIDRIEALTASIFEAIRQNPDKGEEARRFVNYYLPTTLKLLQTYSLMEKQSYQGENIQSSRRRIEAMLDRVVTAIERQQDKLFRSDALDVETDIQVLETLMTSDGLLNGVSRE